MKLIGITASSVDGKNVLNSKYLHTFNRYDRGLSPIIIPIVPLVTKEVYTEQDNIALTTWAESYADRLDVLVLSGGSDINPISFDKENSGSLGCNIARDRIEMELVNAFVRVGRPVIGICRGFQFLGAMCGMQVLQDISEIKEKHNGHELEFEKRSEVIHSVQICGDFQEYCGAHWLYVNSLHHQGILITEAENNLDIEVLAKTKNLLEGFKHRTLPIVGFQYHPEEFDDSITINYIIDNIIK